MQNLKMNVKNINVQVLASISNALNLLRILEMNLWCQSGSDFFDLDFGNWICKKEKEKLYPLFEKMRQRRKVPFLRFVSFVVGNFDQGRHFVMHELYLFYVWFAMHSLLEKALQLSCCWPSCSTRRCRKMNPRGQKGV